MILYQDRKVESFTIREASQIRCDFTGDVLDVRHQSEYIYPLVTFDYAGIDPCYKVPEIERVFFETYDIEPWEVFHNPFCVCLDAEKDFLRFALNIGSLSLAYRHARILVLDVLLKKGLIQIEDLRT